MAQVVVEMSSDEAKLYRGMQRIIEQQRRMDRGNKTVKNSGREAGRQHEQSFGARASASLATYATGLFSISAAVGFVVQGLNKANQATDELAQKQRASQPALAKLTQLAATYPVEEQKEQLDRMIRESKATFGEGGATTPEAAYALQFALESASMQKYRQDIAKLQGVGVVSNAEEMITNIAALIKNLGEKEVGGFREAVSKAIGASAGAPTEMPAMTFAAAKAAPQARAMGLTDEELLAASAVLASTTGTGEEAKVQLEGFLKQVEKEGIAKGKLPAGLSIRGYVEEIDKQLAAGADVRGILGGRQQAITGYRSLSANMADFTTNLESINRAAKTDAFGRAIRLAESVPESKAVIDLQAAENRAYLAREDVATRRTRILGYESERIAQMGQEKRSEFRIAMEVMAQYMAHWLIPDETLLDQLEGRRRGPERGSRSIIKNIENATDNLRRATEEHADARRQQAAAKVVPE